MLKFHSSLQKQIKTGIKGGNLNQQVQIPFL
jgi:hypothetical protein